MVATLIFILILSFLVIIHELGHFLTAKWAKIKIEEFGLGYPPKAIRLFRKWGVDFTLNWIPFGGFVKMVGEDGPENLSEAEKKSSGTDDKTYPFYDRPAWQRLIVVLAGATVNFVFGIVAFAIVFSILGIPTPLSSARIGQVIADSPAAQAGLPAQVEIIAAKAGGEEITQPSTQQVIEFVKNHRGQQVTLSTTGRCEGMSCQESVQVFTVYARTEAETPAGQGSLGIGFDDFALVFYPWYEMPFRGSWYGLQQAVMLGWLILSSLSKIIVDLLTQGVVPRELSGPVGIVSEAQRSGVFAEGFLATLSFAGMLSINLGVMNVLPIPALDGGRAVFIILEKIIGRRNVNKFEGYANYGGMIFLLAVIVLITGRDIARVIWH